MSCHNESGANTSGFIFTETLGLLRRLFSQEGNWGGSCVHLRQILGFSTGVPKIALRQSFAKIGQRVESVLLCGYFVENLYIDTCNVRLIFYLSGTVHLGPLLYLKSGRKDDLSTSKDRNDRRMRPHVS